MARDRTVCVGIITGAHGVRGLVRVKSFTADPAALGAYGVLTDRQGRREFRIELRSAVGDQWLARIEGVDDRDAAEALRGTELHVERDRLPPPEDEEFYHADLIGLRAELPDGTELGVVRAIHDFGAGDILELQRRAGGPVMVPFTRTVVPVIDLAAGRLVVEPPVGLLDEPADAPKRKAGRA